MKRKNIADYQDESTWPICKYPHCQKRIPYDAIRDKSIIRWQKRQYCGNEHRHLDMSHRAQEALKKENRNSWKKNCKKCGEEFFNDEGVSSSRWDQRVLCRDCRPVYNHRPRKRKKPETIAPGFTIFEMPKPEKPRYPKKKPMTFDNEITDKCVDSMIADYWS